VNTWEKEPERFEISIRHGHYHPLDLAHPPWSFTGIPSHGGMTVSNTAFLQLLDAGFRIFPLFPNDGLKTPPNPVLDGTETVGTLRDPVVVPPAAHVLIEVEDDLVSAFAAAATGQFPHPVLEPFGRL
jgi:hypothetical protein